MKIYEQITVDITNPYPLPKMQAQQGNIGRGAKIKLVHNGALIELDKEVVNLYARLPESTEAVYLSTTIADGVITADFTNVMLSKPGAVQVEIQIIEGDTESGTQITTPIFVVEVNPSNINTGEIIASSEFNALVEALAEVQEYKANGLKGDKGDAATIQIGTVETLEPNQNATVSNSGTVNDAVLNFGIPKGDKGDKGEPGAIQTVNGQAPDASGNVTIETASSSYTDLTNKPSINGTELTGNRLLVATINGQAPNATGEATINTVPGDKAEIEEIKKAIAKIRESFTFPNAGSHNSIYRGKYLGNSVTSEQYQAIADGTFTDLFIGDYWTIGDVNYRIGAFDYFLNTGDINTTKHHIVVVPDSNLYDHAMNDTNITTGGYVGSKMYTEGLGQAKTTIKSAFSGHVLSHRIHLTNSIANGRASNGAWYNSEVDLMNEHMVYGNGIFSPVSDGTNIPANYRVEKSQLPLFAHNPSIICNRTAWWLRDVISASNFVDVANDGNAHCYIASKSRGVRPYFCIYGGD